MFMTLLASFIFLSSSSFAQGPRCEQIFKQEVYGQVRSSFQHSKKYDVVIKEASPIKDQCEAPLCHLYAWSTQLETTSRIRISNEYLDVRFIYETAKEAVEAGYYQISLGEFALKSRHMISKVGLAPEGAWKGRKNFVEAKYFYRFNELLNNILMQSSWARNHTRSPREIHLIKERAKSQIRALIENMIGPIDITFKYQGKTYDPKSFAREFFPELYGPTVHVTIAREWQRPRKNKADVTYLVKKFDEAEHIIRNVIDSGRPVFLSYSHQLLYVDKKTGIMSISAYDYPTLVKPTSYDQFKFYEEWGNHAVMIVGYEMDPATGQVRKWKIKNSWGTEYGDKGYYHMYQDYFRAFAWEFTFVDEGLVQF